MLFATIRLAVFGRLDYFVGWDGKKHHEIYESFVIIGRSAFLTGLVILGGILLSRARSGPPSPADGMLSIMGGPAAYAVAAIMLALGPVVALCSARSILREKAGSPDPSAPRTA